MEKLIRILVKLFIAWFVIQTVLCFLWQLGG